MEEETNYDLTPVVARFMDRHLVFPLLGFLDELNIYKVEDSLKAKLKLLSKTNMVDYGMELYCALNKTESAPAEMKAQRDEVVSQLKQLQAASGPLLRVIENNQLLKTLRAEKRFTPEYLQENHEVTPEVIESFYKYAKFQYECGNYQGAAEYLYHYRQIAPTPERKTSALWGKLAAEILMQNWNDAVNDLSQLRELIDQKSFTPPLMQLQQRTWLIHWSLFVFFNHPDGLDLIIDLFTQDRYLNAIQTTCPHILRYLTTAVIVNKKRRNILKDVVKVIQQESYTYRDPVTEFLEALYVNFDFEEAHLKLRQCDQLLQADFFLAAVRNEFIANARLYIFETYCRIHQKIDITMLADKLGMGVGDAEKWIVNLIRNAKLDAKIDSKDNHVIMGTQYPSVYQKVIEKTKGLSFRSYQLATNLSKTDSATPGKFQDENEDILIEQ